MHTESMIDNRSDQVGLSECLPISSVPEGTARSLMDLRPPFGTPFRSGAAARHRISRKLRASGIGHPRNCETRGKS